jgi:hypothetical protein
LVGFNLAIRPGDIKEAWSEIKGRLKLGKYLDLLPKDDLKRRRYVE